MSDFLGIMIMIKLHIYRAIEFFKGKKNKRKNGEIEFGEILASGSNSVEIDLINLPRHIEVKFKHHEHHTPCDNHHDKLHYEFHKFQHQYRLIIKWDVGSLREISWIAYF